MSTDKEIKRFCSQCGQEVNSNDVFCSKCGTQLQDTPPATRQPLPKRQFQPTTQYTGQYTDEAVANYAGFWKRLAATLIDALILMPVSYIVDGIVGSEGVAILLGFVIGWLYNAGMESSEKQATLGKMVLGIYVTDLEGQRLQFTAATIRWLAQSLSAITLGVGYIMVAFTAKKQGLHDIVAKTLVHNR